MALHWFYKVKDEEQGPISSGELKQKAEEGVVILTTPVRREGDAKWAEARLVKGLFPPAIAEAAAKAAKARAAAEREAAAQEDEQAKQTEAAPEPAAAREEPEESPIEMAPVEMAPIESAVIDPADLEPITLPPLEPEPQAPAKQEPEPKRKAKAAGLKVSPLLLAGGGGVLLIVMGIGILAWVFLRGGEEQTEPPPVAPIQVSAAQEQLNQATRLVNNEQYKEAQALLARLMEQELAAGEQTQAKTLLSEAQDALDSAAAAELLAQIEQNLAQKNIRAMLMAIEAYEENPYASEAEKARLASLIVELERATSPTAVQERLAAMSEEELQAVERGAWEPELPYENEVAREMALSTMKTAAVEEVARRQQSLTDAAAAEVAATRLSREDYLEFRQLYDDYMLRIAELRLKDLDGEPTPQRWTYLENFPKLVQDHLDYSQSFAGRKQILGIAASCRQYLEDRGETVAEREAAIETLQAEVTASAERYPEDSLASSVFTKLAEVLASQQELLANEAETLEAAHGGIQFEYGLDERRQSESFVQQLVQGMLTLRAALVQIRTPQNALVFDVWATTQSDSDAEWETEYQEKFLAENVAAIEGYLGQQQSRLESAAGMLGHWRRQTAGEESLGLDLFVEVVELATYPSPPAGSSWDTAALLRPGASYLKLPEADSAVVLTKPPPDQVAALTPEGEEPTGFSFAYLVSGEAAGDPHRLVALHVTAMRTVAPQGKLEGWCVVDEEGRLYFMTGARFSWTTPPVVTELQLAEDGEQLAARTCTHAGGLRLAQGLLQFAADDAWSAEPGVTVLAGEYTFVGENKPSWAADFAAPQERPVEEHPFTNWAWRNESEAVEEVVEAEAGVNAPTETEERE